MAFLGVRVQDVLLMKLKSSKCSSNFTQYHRTRLCSSCSRNGFIKVTLFYWYLTINLAPRDMCTNMNLRVPDTKSLHLFPLEEKWPKDLHSDIPYS